MIKLMRWRTRTFFFYCKEKLKADNVISELESVLEVCTVFEPWFMNSEFNVSGKRNDLGPDRPRLLTWIEIFAVDQVNSLHDKELVIESFHGKNGNTVYLTLNLYLEKNDYSWPLEAAIGFLVFPIVMKTSVYHKQGMSRLNLQSNKSK